jgi:mono/diheme cytochrome c family protein
LDSFKRFDYFGHPYNPKEDTKVKRHIAVILAIMFVAGMAQVAFSAAPSGKITITLGGAKTATFDHTAHVSRADGNCQKCHHKDAKGAEQKCSSCHTKTGKDGAIAGKKAFHAQCGACHKAKAKGPQYPKDCKVCHG